MHGLPECLGFGCWLQLVLLVGPLWVAAAGAWVRWVDRVVWAGPPSLLTVTPAGTGAGVVSSSPAGISCGADCTESYASGTVVTLTASAEAGSEFAGWSGACTGTAVTCQV